ncbi:hypothetical protein AK88_00570 [Plasmodium fragile]|uniref:CCHC-type domain-containing protein n=1 Tax=Plasmodium fragile TaxID=5857 RepID=A0A0D9QS12_PLAFR|nr:uncharacterized protein AK88_00570 [Plasmodium fragile]KJP89859.1 hypothetical protein AK88_00570 [Plasmodium fragile]
MIDTFIYWNFRGSKGNANVLRISLPCSYNTIKKKILEVTNLNLQNNLDILLYHNNRVLSEYESIQNEMLIEIQRSNVDVVKELLHKSNNAYLDRNKNNVQDNRRGGATPLSGGRQSEVRDSKVDGTSTIGSTYDSGGIGGSHRGVGGHEGKPSSLDLNRPLKMSRTANYPYSSKQPWNVYNRNAISVKENNEEDDEDMKIQEMMEKNNPYYQRSDYAKSRMLNYYKKDRNNVSQFYMNNKFKKVAASPSSTPSASASSIAKNLSGYNSMSSTSLPRGGEHQFQNGMAGAYSKFYKMRGASQSSGYGSAMSHSTYANSRNQQKTKIGNNSVSNQDTSTKYVSPDYICHMCGKKGHSIKNCTMSSFNNNKKIKVPTGIPTNFLTKIKPEDINKYDQIYILKDGSYGVLKDVEDVSGSAYLYRSVDDKINIYLGVNNKDSSRNGHMDGDQGGDGRGRNAGANSGGNLLSSTNQNGNGSYPNEEGDKISNLYKCLLCKKLYSSPTTLPCCGETYCKGCLYRYNRKRKNDYSSSQFSSSSGYQQNGDGKSQMMKCPNCHKLINSDALIINTNIKNVIDTIIRNQKVTNANKDEEDVRGGNASNGVGTNMATIGGMSHMSSDKNATSYNRATNGVTNNTESSSSRSVPNGKLYQRQPLPSGSFPPGSDLPSKNSRTTEEQNSLHSSSLCNDNEDEFQDNSFNPLINLPINLLEIQRQHDFAAAYIAKYKMRRKPKRKRTIDLEMLFMTKRRVC